MLGSDEIYSDSIQSTRRRMEMVSEIVPGELYLSSLLGAVQPLDNLTSKKISHIVSITGESFPRHRGMEYLVVDEDDTPETDLIQHFQVVNVFIDGAKAAGNAVLVHCQAGISRSATATIAYIMYSRGLGAEEAYSFVKSRRNCIMPNLGFVRQLQEYEEILRTQNKILPSPTPETNTTNTIVTTSTAKFLVHFIRTTIPAFTKELSDDQIASTAESCEYNYIVVLANLRAKSLQPAC